MFDTTLAPGGSTYAFRGNRCDRNGKAGIKLVSDARRDLTGVAIVDNEIHGNGSLGVHVVTTGAWVRNVTISSNRVSANGQTNTAGYTQAIRIDAPTERFTIAGNNCWDPGPVRRQTHGIQLSAARRSSTATSSATT